MKTNCNAMVRGVTLVMAILLLVGLSKADDKKLPQNPQDLVKAMEAAGKPGAEHAKLEPLVGSWSYTCKFWMDPSQPPMESKGTIERRWILGGRFLEEKVTGTNFDGKPGFEGLGLVGYDNGQKKYTTSWNCSMGTGTCTGLGAFDGSGTKLTIQTESFCPIEKKIVKGREELRFESSDKTVAESYVIQDGKEVKMMELVSIRKK